MSWRQSIGSKGVVPCAITTHKQWCSRERSLEGLDMVAQAAMYLTNHSSGAPRKSTSVQDGKEQPGLVQGSWQGVFRVFVASPHLATSPSPRMHVQTAYASPAKTMPFPRGMHAFRWPHCVDAIVTWSVLRESKRAIAARNSPRMSPHEDKKDGAFQLQCFPL